MLYRSLDEMLYVSIRIPGYAARAVLPGGKTAPAQRLGENRTLTSGHAVTVYSISWPTPRASRGNASRPALLAPESIPPSRSARYAHGGGGLARLAEPRAPL